MYPVGMCKVEGGQGARLGGAKVRRGVGGGDAPPVPGQWR